MKKTVKRQSQASVPEASAATAEMIAAATPLGGLALDAGTALELRQASHILDIGEMKRAPACRGSTGGPGIPPQPKGYGRVLSQEAAIVALEVAGWMAPCIRHADRGDEALVVYLMDTLISL